MMVGGGWPQKHPLTHKVCHRFRTVCSNFLRDAANQLASGERLEESPSQLFDLPAGYGRHGIRAGRGDTSDRQSQRTIPLGERPLGS